ncbi:glutamine amidotransferase-related protein [Photobacterium atrarenae]|uniref:Glutamine amidotransferase n=1 Tax=Photobacterium atrarenae TaxID=865757 RepID=A0ABY5GLE9_9GAMM|nr:glutamine amidotransferase [Photobacterium atrarenae]UTV29559.1 glutamine amidotransferase [Photobacterium atrarenae]
MHIHFLIHESFEGPGYFATWAARHDYTISATRLYLGEPLPADDAPFDLLVILGGPQNPQTSVEACPHFNSLAEQAVIRQAISRQKAVVGVCLGAQLIGEALSASYAVSPEPEIGYFPIQLTKAGEADPKLATWAPEELVGHWHNDMPGLTEHSTVLASSAGCPRQIVRYTELVYGFQCHLEFQRADLPPLIEHDQPAFASPKPYIQAPEVILAHDPERMNQLLGDFLDQLMLAYQGFHTDSVPGDSAQPLKQ